MNSFSRRHFLRQTSLGLATAGLLKLSAHAMPTESSGELGSYGQFLLAQGESPELKPQKTSEPWRPTEKNIEGPFYRQGAPFRGKVTPPGEPGTLLLISGQVWGFDTRKPLNHAVLDIWQANANGRYDNDDPNNPPAKNIFRNRARLATDENGYYEFETIYPGAYKTGSSTWRPNHIHYMIRHPGYKTLITQLYFRGDKHQDTDPFIRPSLIIDLQNSKNGDASFKTGHFDIILAPEK